MLTKKGYFDVINRASNYVPLIVNVIPESGLDFSNEECMDDPEKNIQRFADMYKLSMQVGSDLVPFIESCATECLIPAIYGGKKHVPSLLLREVRPFIRNIYEAENFYVDNIFCPVMESAIEHLKYTKDNAPEAMVAVPPRPLSPLDYAVLMRGGDFYLDMAEEPELSAAFLNNIADTTIKAMNCFKELLGQKKDEWVALRGMYFPGIRISGDAVVNLSPGMIGKFMNPIFQKFADEYNAVMLHYCTTPSPSGHVIGSLPDAVLCVDNWQGHETLFSTEDEKYQTKIGVCTDISAEDITGGSVFANPFFTMKNRPLFVSVNAKTIDEGKCLYEVWNENFY